MTEQYSRGLTTSVRGKFGSRCYRCDMPLNHSTHKGLVVVYRNNVRKSSAGYICVRCCMTLKKVSEDELDNFVNSLMVVS